MISALKSLVLPPASLLLLLLAGLWAGRRHPRLGRCVALGTAALLYVLSTPVVSALALRMLEPAYVDPRIHTEIQAIVVLAGGTIGAAPEYATDSVTHLTLARVRYAAHLQRQTGKPILVSGGSLGEGLSEARQMHSILTAELNVPVRWLEERSVDTYTNALESYRILGPLGITRIHLVTHAWHVPRARLAFEHAGFRVTAAPTGFTQFDPADLAIGDFLPRASALLNSYYFCHEVLGYAMYVLRIRFTSAPGGARNEGSHQVG